MSSPASEGRQSFEDTLDHEGVDTLTPEFLDFIPVALADRRAIAVSSRGLCRVPPVWP
jgi:hypothetical protein